MFPEVHQIEALGEGVANEAFGYLRNDYLPAVRGRHQASGAVDNGAEIVAAVVFRLAHMQAHADS